VKPTIRYCLDDFDLPDYETYVRTIEQKKLQSWLLLGSPILIMFGVLPVLTLATPLFTQNPDYIEKIFFIWQFLGFFFLYYSVLVGLCLSPCQDRLIRIKLDRKKPSFSSPSAGL
jgi:hypothetical protein